MQNPDDAHGLYAVNAGNRDSAKLLEIFQRPEILRFIHIDKQLFCEEIKVGINLPTCA